MDETTPSGGLERFGAAVARAVDEDRRERFRREDAEHEAADKRLAAEEAIFQAGLAAGIDAAEAAHAVPETPAPAPGSPAPGTPDHVCRDCRRKLPVLGRICPECFRLADGVLADVEWWERFAGEYAAAVRFALRYKRLDAESFAALREGFGGYPEEATPFRRASDRILRYSAGHLRELNATALDAAHDVLVAAFEVPILTGQSHDLVITPAEHMRLRRAFVQAEDVVGKVREYAQRTRGEYFGLHDATCDCPTCKERRAKERDEPSMVRESAGPSGEAPPPPTGATSGAPASAPEYSFLTPDQVIARVDRLARIARTVREGHRDGARATRNPRVVSHSRLGAYHLGRLDRGAKVALLRSMASLAGAEATTPDDDSYARVEPLWEAASALAEAAGEINASAVLIAGAEAKLGPVFTHPEDARTKAAVASGEIGPDDAAALGLPGSVVAELRAAFRCAREAKALARVAGALNKCIDAESESTFLRATAALADGINAAVDIAAALSLDTGAALARPEPPPWAARGSADTAPGSTAPPESGGDRKDRPDGDGGPWIRGTRAMRDFLRNEGYPVASKALNDALKAGAVHGARRKKAGARVTWLAHAESLRTWGSLRNPEPSQPPAE